MGKLQDGKRRWNETIAAQVSLPSHASRQVKTKRLSGRTTKLSKAMKHVDEETRAMVKNSRLEALEEDNYGIDDAESAADHVDLNDGVYIDEEEDKTQVKSVRAPRTPKIKSLKLFKNKYKAKRLAQLVYEEFGLSEASYLSSKTSEGTHEIKEANYLTALAKPSTLPPRHFCCICGYFANYACTRCGSRFCNVKCGDHHKEIGCLKFGL